MNLPVNKPNKLRKFRVVLILGVLFLGPFIAASIYFFTIDKEAIGTMNHGTFIQPPVSIGDLDIATLDGRQLSNSAMNRKWAIVVNNAVCEASCLDNIHKIRQLRLALAQEMTRVVRILTTQTPLDKAQLATIEQAYPDTIIAVIKSPITPPVLAQDGIYIIDPRGFIILQYPLNESSEAIYKDLTHLLKYSHIG